MNIRATRIPDPDGYILDFGSPTDRTEETRFADA
jgi:hypothetical protein